MTRTSTSIFSTEHFRAVLIATVKVINWYALGMELEVSYYKLDEIKRDESYEVDRKREMLKYWLDTGQASWLSLVNALRSPLVNMDGLANEIANKCECNYIQMCWYITCLGNYSWCMYIHLMPQILCTNYIQL